MSCKSTKSFLIGNTPWQPRGYTITILLVLSLLILSPSFVVAAPPIKVKATALTENSVKISINLQKKLKKKNTQLVISRRLDGENNFTVLYQATAKKSNRVVFIDFINKESHRATYKGRVVRPYKTKWSAQSVAFLEQKEQEEETVEEPIDDEPFSPIPVTPTPNDNRQQNPVVTYPTIPSGLTNCHQRSKDEVLNLVNQARATNNLAALQPSSHLHASATSFSIKMAQTQILSHTGWFENILQFGYSGFSFAQNIGYSTIHSPQTIVNSWLASTGHRKNILSTSAKHLGVGCIIDTTGKTWWTQDFGG